MEMADEKTRESWALRRFATALWGDNAYGLAIPIVNVMERSQAEVEAWINCVERPENGAPIIVGDVDPSEALDLADRKLRGAWSDRPAAPAPLMPPPAAAPRSRVGPLPIQFNGMRSQRAGSITFACLLPPARTPRDGVVGDLLGKLIEESLFERLRIHEGKSYARSVRHSQLWGGSAILEGTLDIEDQSVVEGTALIESYLTAGGQSIGDDNGDPMDFTAYSSPTRKAFSGKALAMVQSRAPGQMTVTATSSFHRRPVSTTAQ